MTKREQYKLNFEKLKIDNSYYRYGCVSSNTTINGSPQLANLLDVLSDREPDGLLEEVNLALTGGDYEEYYSPDMSSVDNIKITPPNAVINNSFTISLIDLKKLLQEWIAFIES